MVAAFGAAADPCLRAYALIASASQSQKPRSCDQAALTAWRPGTVLLAAGRRPMCSTPPEWWALPRSTLAGVAEWPHGPRCRFGRALRRRRRACRTEKRHKRVTSGTVRRRDGHHPRTCEARQ
jgi:hypothetical protein